MAEPATRPVDDPVLRAGDAPAAQVGRPVLRYGGADRASGAQRFVADLKRAKREVA